MAASPAPSSGIPWRLIALGVLVPLYCLPNFAYYHDGVMNASYVLFSDWTQRLHPHHLGYNPLIWALWRLTDLHPLMLMASLSRIASLVVLWQTGTLARRWGLSEGWSGVAMVLIGTSFTFWHYGTDAAVYVPTLACLIAIFLHLDTWRTAPPTMESLRKVGVWWVVAVLWHQLAVLVLVPIVWMYRTEELPNEEELPSLNPGELPPAPLFPQKEKKGSQKRTQSLWGDGRRLVGGVRYGSGLIGAVVGCYLAGVLLVFGTAPLENPALLTRWLWRYGDRPHHWIWNRSSDTRTPVAILSELALASHARLVWALPTGERFDAPVTSGFSQAWQAAWPEGRYGPYIALLPWLGGALTLLGSLALWRAGPEGQSRLGLAIAWGLPLFVFTHLFEPQNSFYRLYYFIPWLMVILMSLAGTPPAWVPRLASAAVIAWLALTLSTNTAYGWEPWQRPECNPSLRSIATLRELPPGPIGFHTWGDGFEDFHYARLLLDRPVYTLRWFTEADYVRSRSGDIPLAERLAVSAREQQALGGRFYLSEGRSDSDLPPWSMRLPYVQLSDPQSDQPGPRELWLDLQSWILARRLQQGPFQLLEFTDPYNPPAPATPAKTPSAM